MPSPAERMTILDRLEKGEINPEEATRLLAAEENSAAQSKPADDSPMAVLEQLERGEINADEAAKRLGQGAAPVREDDGLGQARKQAKVDVVDSDRFSPARTWGWWVIPISIGALLTLLAGLWMSADARNGIGLGFFCAWVPLSIGVLLILFGWLSQRGPWAHLRIDSRKRTKPGRVNYFMDLPVPIGVATTVLRSVGKRVPGLEQEDVDKLLKAMQDIGSKGEPIHIRANEDDDDDAVDITIS